MSFTSGGSEPPASSVPPNPRTLRGSRTLRLLNLSQVHMPVLLSGQKENRLRYADGLQKLVIVSVSYIPESVCTANNSLFPRRSSKLCSSKDLKLFMVKISFRYDRILTHKERMFKYTCSILTEKKFSSYLSMLINTISSGNKTCFMRISSFS